MDPAEFAHAKGNMRALPGDAPGRDVAFQNHYIGDTAPAQFHGGGKPRGATANDNDVGGLIRAVSHRLSPSRVQG